MNRNLLPFVKEIIQEIAPPENDDLLIIAKGLGLRKIVATLLKIYDGPTKLVLLINATPDEESGLGELLSTMGVRRPGLRIVSFEMPGKERRALYHAGGLISVTSRILVVDMLTKNIPTEMISGLVVLHAEKVTITSMEAFIVRLYRESNHDGWLKAFSDDPEHFNSTMTPLQTCMKMLSLRRVTLWPRFHASVHASLGQRKADVVELYQPLTTPMKEIQNAIVECMDATLMELRKSCTGVELDDFTVENALFRHFDRIVRGQLDPIWHRVGPKTKRLVSDLTTLRNLLNYLLSYDSITFHTYLESILTAAAPPPGSAPTAARNSNQSPWLYLDAANTLFHVAKRRAYLPPPTKREAAAAASRATPSRNEEVEDEDENEAMRDMEREERERTGFGGGGGGGGNDWDGLAEGGGSSWPPGVTPVLEELPKWSLLAKVLEEIEEEISVQATVDLTISGSNTILVMATGDRTCSQLREYLSSREPFPGDDAEAGRTMMERLLRTYFWWKGGLGDMSRNLRGSKARAGSSTSGKGSSSGTGSGSGSGRGGSSAGGGRGRGQPSFKRRRVRGGSVAASMTSGRKERNAETGEAEEQNAELEDEAEEIADFLHQSSQQFALSSSQAGSVPPSSQRASSSFVRESSMAAPSTPSSSRTRVSNINIIEIPASSSSSSSSTTQPTSTSHSIFSREDTEDIPSIASLTSLASSLNTTRDESSAPPQTLLRPSAQDSVTRYFDPLDFDDNFGVLSPEQLVVIRPYKGDDDDQVLEELRPKYIVMYDADPGFIRRVEVYRSSNPGLGVRVYFMMYVDSVEEQRYLSGLRKEMESFKRLIREKGTMLIPISGDPRGRPAEPNSTQSTLAKVISTRIAGGAAALAAESEPSTVIVDMREFRSTLPSLLHASNVRIIPATLQVGDYILNPEMCVERKSIPDLIQSFNSGRLYTQCEMMSVHYKQPILLIEFEQNKSFSLQSIIELKAPGSHQARSDPTSGSSNSRDRAVADSDIQSRLVLLTLTFPRLRIIWSSSPFATADIFKDLKVNHSEPSAEKAILIGSADGEEGEGGGGNTSAQELLRSLPGVSGKNYRHIMNSVESVKDFCELSLVKMQEIMGTDDGKTAYTFLHRDVHEKVDG